MTSTTATPASKNSGCFVLSRWVFIRFLSLIYMAAFASIAVQMKGLYGTDGIMPVQDAIQHTIGGFSPGNFLDFPSVFLFSASDTTLLAVPVAGSCLALTAFLGILTGPCLLLTWLFYLSIVTVGQIFMSYQWDILLLEVGFLAIFFASWRPLDLGWNWLLSQKAPAWVFENGQPSFVLIALYWWLLFRLMFMSGVVKITSHDPTWADLSAMSYHYWTQPLPTPLGWLAAQLPDWMLKISCAGVFVIELLVPILIFFPRRARMSCGLLLIALQVMIMLTGNYCFFNLLTIAICILLFDDRTIRALAKAVRLSRFVNVSGEIAESRYQPHRIRYLFIIPVTALIVFMSMVSVGLGSQFPSPVRAVAYQLIPWRIVNGYGLFAVMTTDRPEIVVEGSNDGKNWKPYRFKYKAGPLDRAPPVVAPHQPRLDWQMWFASLGSLRGNPWFVRFMGKLLTGSEDVLMLLDHNPFPDSPPRFLRARVFDYRVTSLDTLLRTGRWWRMEYREDYSPVISLE